MESCTDGLFATWMLLTAPEVFTGYVIVSPKKLGAGAPLRGKAYMAAGAMENEVMGADVREMAGRLRARSRAGFAGS